MSQLKELLNQEAYRIDADPDALESTFRRRDRKRRNRRIWAGVVGITVFVAAVWIVTSGWSFDRTETPAVPGPAETDTGRDFFEHYRIPPEGAALSTPVEGELIATANPAPPPNGYTRVYADGRVLSLNGFNETGGLRIVERRLSPKGVELVRSGALTLDTFALDPASSYPVPASAWEDGEGKPYVPARYGACFWHTDLPLDVEAVLDLLPASAQALLRGSDLVAWNPRCLEVTPEEARSLEEILSEALSSSGNSWTDVGAWSLRDGTGDQFISLRPLYPDGRVLFQPGW